MITEPMRKSDTHGPTLACLVGSGGLAGASQLIAAVARQRPEGVGVRYIAGPLAELPEQSDGRVGEPARIPPPFPGVETVPEAELNQALLGVSAVVSRAGYNTAYSLMRGDLPVLFIPTAWPEQFQRAQQLSKLEGVMVLSEEKVETGLEESLARLLELPRRPRRIPFRVNGASNTANLLLARTPEGAEWDSTQIPSYQ
jgi:predicted glycosyltransferase